MENFKCSEVAEMLVCDWSKRRPLSLSLVVPFNESNIYHSPKPDEPTTYQRHLVLQRDFRLFLLTRIHSVLEC